VAAPLSGRAPARAGAGDQEMIVAIHQPNFFPWLGYFQKIARADAFVFLDAVAFSKGSWTNRVRLLVSGQARWATCPVLHKMGQAINEVRIDPKRPWRKKLVKTLEQNYGRAGHFGEVMAWLAPLIASPADLLADFNVPCIAEIARRLGLPCRFVRQSELPGPADAQAAGSAALVGICRAMSADAYLAGDGAADYEDRTAYEAAGVRLMHNRFRDMIFAQVGSRQFVPGLSILDGLFNVGADAIGAFLRRAAEASGGPAG